MERMIQTIDNNKFLVFYHTAEGLKCDTFMVCSEFNKYVVMMNMQELHTIWMKQLNPESKQEALEEAQEMLQQIKVLLK